MEIIFKGRQTDVAARFRDHATAKLERLEKLDQKAIRVDVEVSVERNPRQASQKERVELTIVSRGPIIRAEAAAEDRFAALDMALAKLDSRLRRALDRRKRHYLSHGLGRLANRRGAEKIELAEAVALSEGTTAAEGSPPARPGSPTAEDISSAAPPDADAPARKRRAPRARSRPSRDGTDEAVADTLVPIEMEGDGPLVVRQKIHYSAPMPIDQALLEMELVGHDFYLFHDVDSNMPSVVYRRHGYQYGVIRLVDASAVSHRSSAATSAAGVKADVPASRRPDRSNGRADSGGNGVARRSRKASASRSA
jgi:ribosomal subunit interface protein